VKYSVVGNVCSSVWMSKQFKLTDRSDFESVRDWGACQPERVLSCTILRRLPRVVM
jgi:hypothetical protein